MLLDRSNNYFCQYAYYITAILPFLGKTSVLLDHNNEYFCYYAYYITAIPLFPGKTSVLSAILGEMEHEGGVIRKTGEVQTRVTNLYSREKKCQKLGSWKYQST